MGSVLLNAFAFKGHGHYPVVGGHEMGRPCYCDRVEIGHAFDSRIHHCRACWLFYHDAEHNRAWGGDGNVKLLQFTEAKPGQTPHCVWLGDETGETAELKASCGCKSINIPILRCSVHGKTTGRRAPCGGVRTCFNCPDMLPATMPPVTRRHLLYHIMPVQRNGTWQRHVARLVERMPLFNGTRAVAIVKGRGLDPVEKVQEAFKGTVNEWVITHNIPGLREMYTFFPLWEKLPPPEEGDATWYSHAKGVTKPVNDGVSVHPWADIMVAASLDYWPYVEKLLRVYPCAGSFKKVGYGFSSASAWHYSGTAYWIRNAELMSPKRNWRHHDGTWWGTETYPSLHFGVDEAACIFRQGFVPELNLYSLEYLREKVLPQWEEWKKAHEGDRTDWSNLAR